MARKPRPSTEDKPSDQTAAQSANGKANPTGPKKTRAAAVPTKKKKPSAPKKSAAKEPPATKPSVEPSEEQIRLRAYFLAERRHRLSLPGDSNHDWIEARRQLIEEAKR